MTRHVDENPTPAGRPREPAAAWAHRWRSGSCLPSWRRRARGRRRRSAGRYRPHLPGLLRDPDRHRDRDVRAGAALSIAAAHIEHPPGDDALSHKVDDGRTMQNSSPPVRTRKSPGRSRVDTMRVRCCRPTPVAAWPSVSLLLFRTVEVDHAQCERFAAPL